MKFDGEIKDLQDGVEDYLEHGEYAITDVHTCISLIEAFLINIENSKDKQEGNIHVKAVIVALNELNEQCNGTLIETDQREIIASIINDASIAKGYSSEEEEVTEEFREW